MVRRMDNKVWSQSSESSRLSLLWDTGLNDLLLSSPLLYLFLYSGQPTTYKNVVKYYMTPSGWRRSDDSAHTRACYSSTQIYTRHKNTRALVAIPLFFLMSFLSVGAYSGEPWRNIQEERGGILRRKWAEGGFIFILAKLRASQLRESEES